MTTSSTSSANRSLTPARFSSWECRRSPRARTPASPYRCCCSRSASCSSPAHDSARRSTSSRPTSTSPTSAPTPTSTPCGCGSPDVLGDLDTYSHNLEPYDPETIPSQLSDDLTSIAADVANGLRHFRNGDLEEALWWWQYSYLASWGTNACGVLSALHSVVAHSRLDAEVDFEDEAELIAVAEALDTDQPVP